MYNLIAWQVLQGNGSDGAQWDAAFEDDEFEMSESPANLAAQVRSLLLYE